ncbi:MAG: glycerol-3-phosphate 1-O-acyltransferase PlsY [Lachnoclostridium sp.]|nr:glycerol-3-phosphate 1-O-acyltransferase PlsY [Lachnoclostridium sp.]
MERLICLAIGYAFGLFQTGYIYGKLHHIDIRQHGSGNAGATNVVRTLGRKAGITVFFGDAFKTIFACMAARILFSGHADLDLLALWGGFGAILGHNFPFYLGFKGGKGIAATAGILAATDWRMCVVCAIIFFSTMYLTRYVSVGSILLVIAFFIMAVMFGNAGDYVISAASLPEYYVLAGVIMGMAIWRHRANIKRLLNGTENKIGAKKK